MYIVCSHKFTIVTVMQLLQCTLGSISYNIKQSCLHLISQAKTISLFLRRGGAGGGQTESENTDACQNK